MKIKNIKPALPQIITSSLSHWHTNTPFVSGTGWGPPLLLGYAASSLCCASRFREDDSLPPSSPLCHMLYICRSFHVHLPHTCRPTKRALKCAVISELLRSYQLHLPLVIGKAVQIDGLRLWQGRSPLIFNAFDSPIGKDCSATR